MRELRFDRSLFDVPAFSAEELLERLRLPGRLFRGLCAARVSEMSARVREVRQPHDLRALPGVTIHNPATCLRLLSRP